MNKIGSMSKNIISFIPIKYRKVNAGYSRVEYYFLYKGLNSTNDTFDHEKYVKIFIRADNQFIEIKRKYQDFLEFNADATFLLGGIFIILDIIFNYYNINKGELSIIKNFLDQKTNLIMILILL